MSSEKKVRFPKSKRVIRNTTDITSVLLVCLFPVVSGIIFFRVLYMGGAPIWFYVLQGSIFLFSFFQAVYFFAIGLINALRRNPHKAPKGGKE